MKRVISLGADEEINAIIFAFPIVHPITIQCATRLNLQTDE